MHECGRLELCTGKVHGVSRKSRDWVVRLPELWEKGCDGVALRFSGVRGSGKEVANDETVREDVHEGQS